MYKSLNINSVHDQDACQANRMKNQPAPSLGASTVCSRHGGHAGVPSAMALSIPIPHSAFPIAYDRRHPTLCRQREGLPDRWPMLELAGHGCWVVLSILQLPEARSDRGDCEEPDDSADRTRQSSRKRRTSRTTFRRRFDVPKSIPNYLRLYREQSLLTAPVELPAGFANALEAFQHTTGWRLRYETGELPCAGAVWSMPIDTGREPCGFLAIEPDPALERQPIDLQIAGEMASSLAQLWRELLATQQSLIEREAELATGVPVIEHRQENKELAKRLTAVLRGGGENIGCQAAALYLLDEATSELKLRAAWNLPHSRFAADPRPLAGALGDLEALCGHAVVLEDSQLFEHWQVPETCQAAVCVPVSSPTMPLGTVWFFSFAPRTFSDPQVNMAEVVAGRLAADLEREGAAERRNRKEQANQTAPDGRERATEPTAAHFAAGRRLARGRLDAADGRVGRELSRLDGARRRSTTDRAGRLPGRWRGRALAASGVRSSLRAHSRHLHRPDEWLARTSADLWCGSAGDQYAQLFCGLIDSAAGRLRYASAGEVSAAMIDTSGFRLLVAPSLALGTDPEAIYLLQEAIMDEGAILLVASATVLAARDERNRPLGIERLAEALVEHCARTGGHAVGDRPRPAPRPRSTAAGGLEPAGGAAQVWKWTWRRTQKPSLARRARVCTQRLKYSQLRELIGRGGIAVAA